MSKYTQATFNDIQAKYYTNRRELVLTSWTDLMILDDFESRCLYEFLRYFYGDEK